MTKSLSRKKSELFLAAFVVSMLAVCCITPMIASESDAAANTDHQINLRLGDTFTYAPQVNLVGSTFDAAGTGVIGSSDPAAISGAFLTWDPQTGTLSGKTTSTGSYTAKITASFTGDGITQTASQTISFVIYDKVAITSSPTACALKGDVFSYNLTYAGPEGTSAGTVSIPETVSGWLTYNNGVLSGTCPADCSVSSVTVSIPVSFAATSDTINFVLTIGIYDDVSITSSDQIYTYVGKDTEYTITTNLDGVGTITNTSDLSGLTSVTSVASQTGNKINLNFTAGSVVSGNYTDYTFVVRSNGTLDTHSLTEASKTVKVRVYAELGFTTDPTTSSTRVYGSAQNAAQMVVSITVAGASKISYAWGDGNITVVTPSTSEAAIYTVSHDYADAPAKTYQVNITASNDKGSARSVVMYNSESGDWGMAASESDGSLLSDYSLVIITGALGAFALIAFAFGARFRSVLIIGIILLVVTVVGCALDITAISDLLGGF